MFSNKTDCNFFCSAVKSFDKVYRFSIWATPRTISFNIPLINTINFTNVKKPVLY